MHISRLVLRRAASQSGRPTVRGPVPAGRLLDADPIRRFLSGRGSSRVYSVPSRLGDGRRTTASAGRRASVAEQREVEGDRTGHVESDPDGPTVLPDEPESLDLTLGGVGGGDEVEEVVVVRALHADDAVRADVVGVVLVVQGRSAGCLRTGSRDGESGRGSGQEA